MQAVTPNTAQGPGAASNNSNAAQQQAVSENLNTVDFQNFLTLLTTQLRNQDPLSPLDSADFVAQLASFSSVEQLVVANDRLESIASSITGSGIDQYANWIGREAEAAGSSGLLNDGPMRFRLSGDPEATRVEATITDQNGDIVARLLAHNNSDIQQWDGLVNGAAAPAGVYTITADYYDGDEVIRSETANTFGVVKEVRLAGANGEAVIALEGDIAVDPSTVVGLRQPE